MNYRAEIDGLRALAVIPVILYHAGFKLFGGGYVGVDLFFVISGYLITTIIITELGAGTFSLIHFYERRARRILPALFVVMFACLPFAWFWLLPSAMKTFCESLIAVSTYVSNIFFWRQSGYFDTATELKPLIHTWSLAVEEQYYLLFPLFLMLTWKLGRRWIITLLSITALSSLGLAQWGSLQKPAATFFLLPMRVWELLIGALIAFYYTQQTIKKPNHTIEQIGSLFGLILIAYSIFAYNDKTPFPSVYALVPTFGAVLIIIFATHKTVVGRLLGSRIFVAIGLISYSAYLWHQPIFAFVRERSSDEPSLYLMTVLAISSFAFAYLSWKYVERPFRDKHSMSRNKVFSYGVLCSVLFIGFGLAGHLSGGFINRFSPSDRYLASLSVSDAGRYVQKRFNELSMRQFDKNDKRLKVLIIGDSYGQDLVNALYESDFDKAIQVSTRHISARCGNLFIKRDLFNDEIFDSDKRLLCDRDDSKELYTDEKLRALMLSADEIWLASAWQNWQIKMIKQSILNITSFTQKDVRVFGKKDFGKIEIKKLLGIADGQRLQMRGYSSKDTIKINAQLESEIYGLPATSFIDVAKLLCGDDVTSCPLFTDDGSLISYDGGHLTRFGAKYFGEKLFENKLIEKVLSY